MRRAVFNMRDERPVWAPPADAAARIRDRLGSDWQLVDVAAPVSGRGDGGGLSEEALAAIDGAEIYFGLGMPRDLLRAGLRSGRLRWIHTGAAGVASLLHPELASGGVTLTNSAGIHAEPIAESVLGMMLHFARGFDYAVRAQARRDWDTAAFEKDDGRIFELGGATVGIVGLGGIGRAVARRCTALGMRVVAVSRSGASQAPLPRGAELIGATARLRQLLAVSDFVVVTVPATSETRGLVGADELAAMKRGAVIINAARGEVVDEDALTAALRSGQLRGAGLDVFAREPLPEDSPLWALDNVLITPHVSGTTPRFWSRQLDLIRENIGRYLAGERLLNTVDVSAGY